MFRILKDVHASSEKWNGVRDPVDFVDIGQNQCWNTFLWHFFLSFSTDISQQQQQLMQLHKYYVNIMAASFFNKLLLFSTNIRNKFFNYTH